MTYVLKSDAEADEPRFPFDADDPWVVDEGICDLDAVVAALYRWNARNGGVANG